MPTAQAMARLGLVNETMRPSPRFFTSTPPSTGWRSGEREMRLPQVFGRVPLSDVDNAVDPTRSVKSTVATTVDGTLD